MEQFPDTVANAGRALRRAGTSARELVERSLAAIDTQGAVTNAFIVVDRDGARAAADAVDAERANGIDRGPLHGIPVSIKDLIDVAGFPTTAASRVRAGHVAAEDAPLVKRLRGAGAVLIGKTNLHEFALGTTSEDSAWGAVRNPHDATRSAGGSSGGSAAAVWSGMGLASIGSDTGGSIRIPAAACGVVGLKPTYGEVPVEGVVPLCASFDHVGPITRSVEDAVIVWRVLAHRPAQPVVARDVRTLRLAVLGGFFTALLDAPVRAAFSATVDALRRAGAQTGDVELEDLPELLDVYASVSLSEAAHWHARTLDSRACDYTEPVRTRLELGRTVPAIRYLWAQDARVGLRRTVDAALDGIDALILPTLPIVAPKLGVPMTELEAPDGNPLPVRAAMLRLTHLFNMTGHPAISIPIPTDGLPVGLQIVGRRGATDALLDVAASCEVSVLRAPRP